MFGDMIEYECVRSDHVPLPVPTGREITIHDGCWAHCPAGADDAHDWQRIPLEKEATTSALS